MRNMGYIEDRLVTPYIIWEHLPTQTKYVDFPFALNPSILPVGSPASPSIADYQQKRYYSDERPMKWEDFKKMAKGNFIKEPQMKDKIHPEYCCCNTAHKKGIKCPIHEQETKSPKDKIREILRQWFKDQYENEVDFRHDISHALQAILSLVRGEIPTKKEPTKIPVDWTDVKYIVNEHKEYNQAITDLHKKFGGEG